MNEIILEQIKRIDPINMEENKVSMLLAVYIKDQMERKGWSALSLANNMNVAEWVVEEWLTGRHDFQMFNIIKLANLFDSDAAMLFKRLSQDLKPGNNNGEPT